MLRAPGLPVHVSSGSCMAACAAGMPPLTAASLPLLLLILCATYDSAWCGLRALRCRASLQAFRLMMFRADQELKWMHFDELRSRYTESLEAQRRGEAMDETLTVAAWVRQHLALAGG